MAISKLNPARPFRIYDYVPVDNNAGRVDCYGYPGDIDYKKGLRLRLSRKDTFIKGHLKETIYYESYDAILKVHSTPVVRVIADYVYAGDGLIDYRDKDWYYYDEAGNEYWMKGNDRKYYLTPTARRAEGRVRRQNVIDNIELNVVGMLVQAAGMSFEEAVVAGTSFTTTYSAERDSFLKDHTDMYPNAIATDSVFSWLDTPLGPGVTIRLWCINELQPPAGADIG